MQWIKILSLKTGVVQSSDIAWAINYNILVDQTFQ